jgi:hypothetical protein
MVDSVDGRWMTGRMRQWMRQRMRQGVGGDETVDGMREDRDHGTMHGTVHGTVHGLSQTTEMGPWLAAWMADSGLSLPHRAPKGGMRTRTAAFCLVACGP